MPLVPERESRRIAQGKMRAPRRRPTSFYSRGLVCRLHSQIATARRTIPVAAAPATLPERTMYRCARSQLSPARNARNVIRANQTADALATESITLKAGSLIAPANGGTMARTPGRKRLTNSPGNPYFLCSFLILSSASGPAYLSILRRNAFAPKRRPSAYVTPAPATLPIQPSRKTVTAEPWALLARKLPTAITAADGKGGKKFSKAESAPIAT